MTRIDVDGVAGSQALKTYAEQRVWSWIGHLERNLEVVTVCLAHEGYRGGLQSRCRMITRPFPWANVAVEETDVDPYAAIDRSAQRLAALVALAKGGPVGQPARAPSP